MRPAGYLPILFLVVVCTLIDLYVFQGVKTLVARLDIQSAQRVQAVYWVISFAILATFIFNFYKAIPTGKFTLLFNTVFNAFLTLFITKIVFILVLLAEDIYRIIILTFSDFPERSVWVSRLALILAGIPFLSFIFGITRGKYHYKVRRTTLYLEDLPENFDGFTITQISDIHSGSLDSRRGVQRGIDLINAQRSDLFVFTGDLVNNKASEVEPWIPLFSEIEARFGKFSVLGNHDYGDYVRWPAAEHKAANLAQLKLNHQRLGFKLLLDEHVILQKGDQTIALLGIENWGLGFGQRGNLNQALQGIDTKTIKVLLSHDPSHWDAEVKNHPENIHLTLAGHTHGMQFGIELFGLKWSPVKYRYPNWAGLAEENGRYLYVNRGFGFLGFAGRVGIWPEITVIELKKSGQQRPL
jgi:hypothetical protein